MTIRFHRDFVKQYKKLQRGTQKKFDSALHIFIHDEFDPILNNHPLQGQYDGYRSINVTGDVRALYRRNTKSAVFIKIGSHSKLYK